MQNIIITYYYQLLALNWILSRIILSYFLILRIKFDAVYNLDIALCFSMLFVINMSPEVVSSKHAHLYVCVESVLELALCQLAIILYSYCVLLHYIYISTANTQIYRQTHPRCVKMASESSGPLGIGAPLSLTTLGPTRPAISSLSPAS